MSTPTRRVSLAWPPSTMIVRETDAGLRIEQSRGIAVVATLVVIAFACVPALRLLAGEPGTATGATVGVAVVIGAAAMFSAAGTVRFLARAPLVLDARSRTVSRGDRVIAGFDELAGIGMRQRAFFQYRHVEVYASLASGAELVLGIDLGRRGAARAADRIGALTRTAVIPTGAGTSGRPRTSEESR